MSTDKKIPAQKSWFQIELEGYAPVKIRYRIFAESEKHAFDLFEKGLSLQNDGQPIIDHRRIKKIKATVKNTINAMNKFIKQY